MAEAATDRRDGSAVGIVAAIVGVAVLLGALYALSGGDRRLDRSLIGVEGLGGWLSDHGVPARLSHPRLHPAIDEVALRILPLYDLDLYRRGDDAEGDEEFTSGQLRDIERETVATKLDEVPTLIALPKWRGALMRTGIAHDQSLIPLDELKRLSHQLGFGPRSLVRAGPKFLRARPLGGAEIALFQAQIFSRAYLPANCTEVIGTDVGALVVTCPTDFTDKVVWLLSDPDLVNNHGLGLGENAAFAAEMARHLLNGDTRPVYIDRSPDLLLWVDRVEERFDYERGTDEFSRFLTYPFIVLWPVMLIVAAVLAWRGAVRFGPVAPPPGAAREMSKRAAIAAKARLLRLTGNDGRMVADHVRAQLQDLARRRVGGDGGSSAQARLMAVIARRDPDLAASFATAAQDLVDRAEGMSPTQLSRHLGTYQTLFGKVSETHGSD